MDQTISNFHEHDGDSTQSSNSAGGGDVNHPSVTLLTDQSDELGPQETGTEIGDSNNGNGPEAEHHVAGLMIERRSPEEALLEIKRQETHDLYCPNCSSKITKTAKLFVKGQETYPYNKKHFELPVPLVIPSKLPTFSLPWFPRNDAEPAEITSLANTDPNPNPNPDQVETIQPDHNPNRYHITQEPPTIGHSLNSWPWLSFNHMWFLLVVVLMLLAVVLLRSPPGPFPPSLNPFGPSQTPPDAKLISVSWVINFSSINYISVTALSFLAILIMLWPSNIVALGRRNDTYPQYRDDNETNGQGHQKKKNKNGQYQPSPPNQGLWERIVPLIINLLPRELDILKSIVYGGLMESITSLGVVSSAAASGASTLNVLALGIANLSSGLFLIIHNLYGLITSRPRIQTANNDHMANMIEEDPYQNLLGNRSKKNLHCVVVVVSFIFFGVIPPLFYGLSFKRTDKGHYKAAVVLAASLVCVISLSFAKAYAFNMRKLKTVVEYTGIAIGGSALSFIASQMVSDLFEKYGFHELASDYLKG